MALETESKPRSGSYFDRNTIVGKLHEAGSATRADVDHLTGKQCRVLIFELQLTLAALEHQHRVRLEQSHG